MRRSTAIRPASTAVGKLVACVVVLAAWWMTGAGCTSILGDNYHIAKDSGTDANTGSSCSADADCARDPDGPVCDFPSGKCGECSPSQSTCPASTFCTSQRVCQAGCNSDTDCGGVLTCEVSTHQCTGCTTDADCPAGTLCDTTAASCKPGCTPEHACMPGLDCCNGQCLDLKDDEANCGACNDACSTQNGTPFCTNGACTITCAQQFADCDANARSNGCETKITDNPQACGDCVTVCSVLNGTGTCLGRQCAIQSCTPPHQDCDAPTGYGTGCETNTNTDVAHCGGCTNACTNANGTTTCNAGTCQPSCAVGFADCDNNPNNGCETDTSSSVTHCGGCAPPIGSGTTCSLQNATPECRAGQCKIATCDTGFANCDLNPANGCETPANTVDNCGDCGVKCTNDHGNTSCVPASGGCVPSCNTGYKDCDGNPNNGCETNTDNDKNNCGLCMRQCLSSEVCSMGGCTTACLPGFENCDTTDPNCETNKNLDSDHCGACTGPTAVCADSKYCSGGACTNCPAGKLDCNGGIDGCEVSSDPNNCGSCGNKCGSDGTCGCTGSCSGGTFYFSEDFSDNSRGWTMPGVLMSQSSLACPLNGQTTTEWQIGPTAAGGGYLGTGTGTYPGGQPDPAQDHSTTTDNGVAGVVLGGNYQHRCLHPMSYLTSPVIDLSGAGGTVLLTFWRWLNGDECSGSGCWMQHNVEVFNGTSWVVIFNGTALFTDAAWTRQEFNVTSYKNAQFRVRFGYSTAVDKNLYAWGMSGWNIDDVTLSSATCQ